jgi:membrane protease YdiL (CAAX protease family)
VTPLDPDSTVDMMGLVLVLTGTVVLTLSNMAAMTMLTESSAAGGGGDGDGFAFSVGIPDLVLQGVWWVVVSYAAVGFWYVRSLPEATARLGITGPTWRVIGAGVGFLALTYLAATVIGLIAQVVQPDATTDVDQIVEQMTANVQNPVGALVLGLSAGIGEEAIFRGALQPRYGIVLTSLAFAALHTGQYGINFSTVGIFAISILFGIERQRFGTTAAMITHSLFDIVQVLALTLAS